MIMKSADDYYRSLLCVFFFVYFVEGQTGSDVCSRPGCILILTGSVPVQWPVVVGENRARRVAVGIPVQWVVSEKKRTVKGNCNLIFVYNSLIHFI